MENNNQALHLKKEILIRLVKAFFSEDFEDKSRLIPYDMRPKGSEVPYRCCVYKERAIIKDRIIAGLGFSIEEDDETTLLSEYSKKALEREKPEDNPLTVLSAACKGCVPRQIYVTDLCQGCIARPCQSSCKFGAITFENGRSVIDSSKCKNCKMCIPVCPYNAIVKVKVPCEDSCPVGAIAKDENGFAKIDFDSCIVCGKCVAACPFAAVHEKSQIIDVLKNIKSGKKVIAMIAPSVVGQFPGSAYQLKTAIIKAGFSDVFEVAQGADITSKNEAKEFEERIVEHKEPFMTTSCCAGYKQLIKKHLPEIKPFVSDTQTPLYYTAEIVKKSQPDSVTVFISPCVAKRMEGFENPNVDYIINFEELGAILIGRKIEIMNCEETPFDVESSKQGRNFGITGGVAEAVKAAAKNENIKPYIISGINKDSIKQLNKYAKECSCDQGNLVEVMCCEGGCIGGNAVINTQKIAKKLLEEFSSQSKDIV